MTGSSDVAVKPSGRVMRATLPTAATTDGSSKTMGTTRSLPLTVILSATPCDARAPRQRHAHPLPRRASRAARCLLVATGGHTHIGPSRGDHPLRLTMGTPKVASTFSIMLLASSSARPSPRSAARVSGVRKPACSSFATRPGMSSVWNFDSRELFPAPALLMRRTARAPAASAAPRRAHGAALRAPKTSMIAPTNLIRFRACAGEQRGGRATMAGVTPGATTRRPQRGAQGGRAPQHAGAGQPHVSWWGEEGIPRVGGSVHVLHEDGVWWPGKLTHCDGTKWRIDFEDGDQDTYTLPHRSACAPCDAGRPRGSRTCSERGGACGDCATHGACADCRVALTTPGLWLACGGAGT